MIKKLDKLHSFGIFHDFRASSKLEDFSQFNLFFGSNGAGKSTLSRLFRTISPDHLESPEPPSQFSIHFSTGETVDHNSPKSHGRKILIFDEDFVKSHIDWDTQVKSILLVSEQKINEKKEFDQKSKDLKTKEVEIKNLEEEMQKVEIQSGKFLSDTAKKLKLNLQTIATTDKQYLNYNKTKLENLISTLDLNNLPSFVLTDTEVERLVKSAAAELKERLPIPSLPVEADVASDFFDQVVIELETKIVAKSIERLKQNPDIANWVKQGLSLAKLHNSVNCEFCGQFLPEGLFASLDAYFNDAFENHVKKLKTLKDQASALIYNLDTYPKPAELYPELRDDFNAEFESLKVASEALQRWLIDLCAKLETKINDPFSNVELPKYDELLISSINSLVKKISSIIRKHNEKTDSFQDSVAKDRKIIEKHFASSYLIDFDYQAKYQEAEKRAKSLKERKAEAHAIKERVSDLEKMLSSETLGASKFNDRLHKFLGHKEISLSFSSDIGGYKILRCGQPNHATKLSEGEKNAIAFIYFATKTREKGNVIGDSIFVIDDPVSSLDSKNIFHAFSFLRSEFSEGKQLFILTHNFLFFRLVRDWILGKNKKDKIKARCYLVNVEHGVPRKASIENATSAIVDYNTEYHFIFQQLHTLSQKPVLTLEETFFTANLSRKLLETFLNFKLPKKRSNFRTLMEDAISDKDLLERVYRFINTYSHYTPIGATDGAIESLVAESPEVIRDVLKIVEVGDKIHFDEMKETA